MKVKLSLLFFVVMLLFFSCKDDNNLNGDIPHIDTPDPVGISRANSQPTILGKQKENPFSLENMQKALHVLQSEADESDAGYTKSAAEEIEIDEPTDLYVRFLPADSTQYKALMSDASLELVDTPLDYEITQYGDYYKDPSLASESEFTWLYATVKPGYKQAQGIDYELLSELFIPENSEYYTEEVISEEEANTTKSIRIAKTAKDYENNDILKALVMTSFVLTGNENEVLQDESDSNLKTTHQDCRKKCIKILWKKICWNDCDTYYHPDGTVQVNTPTGNQPLKGIKIRAWRWFTIETTRTDANGYYRFAHRFSKLLVLNSLNYYVVFDGHHSGNDVYWDINKSIAGALTLWSDYYGMGSHSPNGYSMVFYTNSSYWGRAVLSNAIYDYSTECRRDNIMQQPRELEIAGQRSTSFTASAPLLRNHFNFSIIKAKPNAISVLGQIFAYSLFGWAMPDLMLKYNSNMSDYNKIRYTAWHELTHASQLERMKAEKGYIWASNYWSQNVYKQASNGLDNPYGNKGDESWEQIALSEGWANYRADIVLCNRFGISRYDLSTDRRSDFPRFYRTMFQRLERIGISQTEMERALCTYTFKGYRDNLIAKYPALKDNITFIVDPNGYGY